MAAAPTQWKLDHRGGSCLIFSSSGSSACQMATCGKIVSSAGQASSCLPDGSQLSAPHLWQKSRGLHAHSSTISMHLPECRGVFRHTIRTESVLRSKPPLCKAISTGGSLCLCPSHNLPLGAISTLGSSSSNNHHSLRQSPWSIGRKPGGLRGAPLRKAARVQETGPARRRGLVVAGGAGPELGGAVEVINNLGLDALTFLAATVLVIPAFKALKASPILGFLLSGVILSQFELIRNVTDVKALSELGILFLLFEMGLELSLARLKALAKFAFGIGLPQVLLTTLAFSAFELPPNNAFGTRMLEYFFGSGGDLVNIRSIDEAIVIGAALSLSSSAFVLQLLAERGELPTRFGSATLGILLFQDIAVVPLLVILPILENGDFTDENMFPLLVSAGLKALLGLGTLLLAGRVLLRRFFEVVAESRSPEAFVALCLLTVTGTSLLTQKLGFSDSLGAFLAGALLAETNYRTQVEADIRPFRGLLLGLFFVTTGTSIDFELLVKEWPNILALLSGLIAIKTAIITILGPRVGLTLAESVRTGLLLSQGGEFAFVVFSLANELGVLPIELNQLLIIVVVLSMALTPLLDAMGRRIAERLDAPAEGEALANDIHGDSLHEQNFDAAEPVVIIGFGQMAQVLANFLGTPLAVGEASDSNGWPFVCFDLDPRRVKNARREGFPVLYGDGSRPAVLQTAGIARPKAVVVMYTSKERSVHAVERLRQAWPGVPIYGRARDLNHLLELKMAGATDVVLENAEASLRLGSILLQGLGVMRDDVVFLRRTMRESMDQRAREAYVNRDGTGNIVGMPFKAKVQTILEKRSKDGGNGALLAEGSLGPDADDDPLGPVLYFDDPTEEQGGRALSSTAAGTGGRRSDEVATPGGVGTTQTAILRDGRAPLKQAVAEASAIAASGLATAAGAVAVAASLENGSARDREAHASGQLDESTRQAQGLAASELAGREREETSEEATRNRFRELDDENDERGISYCSLEADDYDGALNYESDGGASYESDDGAGVGQRRTFSAGRRTS